METKLFHNAADEAAEIIKTGGIAAVVRKRMEA